MHEILFVGIGGFIGSCFRYGITRWSCHWPVSIPMGTLLSNVIAGIAIGFIVGLERGSTMLSPKGKLFLTTGLLGGLSTFSTFSLETIDLIGSGKYLLGMGNILLNLSLSLLGVAAGLALARILLKNVSFPW